MTIAPDLRRLLSLFGAMALGLSVWMLVQTDGSSPVRGPGTDDDLPWGDLMTLNATGAYLFVAAAGLTLVAGLTGVRYLLYVSAASWTALAAVVGFVVATQGDALGASRPSTAGIALAMMFVTLLPALVPAKRAEPGSPPVG